MNLAHNVINSSLPIWFLASLFFSYDPPCKNIYISAGDYYISSNNIKEVCRYVFISVIIY